MSWHDPEEQPTEPKVYRVKVKGEIKYAYWEHRWFGHASSTQMAKIKYANKLRADERYPWK